MSQIIDVSPQLKISYQEAGQGIPLVFLHAFPLSSAMWKAQMEEFSSIYRVLCPDFRGLGGTSPFDTLPSIQTLAHDISLSLGALEISEKIVLCGLSMGGYVALEFARAYPDKLRGLILADTRADPDSEEGKKARDEMIRFAGLHDGRAIVQRMQAKLLSETTLQEKREILTQVEAIALQNDGTDLGQLVAAMKDRRDSTDFLSEISCPTLVLGGSDDVVSPPQIMKAMASKIPRAKHVVIDGAGHLANLECPEVFNRELGLYLQELT
jgi:pimeloyl-ACP methyl ester carboxylesterase